MRIVFKKQVELEELNENVTLRHYFFAYLASMGFVNSRMMMDMTARYGV